MIQAIKFISIPVADQDRALEFYTKKLGFILIQDEKFNDNQRWIELTIPDAQTGVVLFTPPGQESRIGGFMNLAWVTDDLDKTYEELKDKGVKFQGPPEKTPWGKMVIFQDSEGNSHCLSQDDREK